MDNDRPFDKTERIELLKELQKRYGESGGFRQRLLYIRKKYFWLAFVEGANFFKRVLDTLIALILLIGLSPLFLLVALLITLTDKGPVFYITTRVGKWGQEFRFPKFRSMIVNADRLQPELADSNQHSNPLTFKMKRDPRVTWIGRIIRKTSIDEFPQLYCVLKGDMSLVGPRPPLPEEVARYTLKDRRRLDVPPGITCIWQVSGRSDIPFEQQVKLDIQYIESQSFWGDLKLLLKTIPAVILGKGAY